MKDINKFKRHEKKEINKLDDSSYKDEEDKDELI